MRRIEKPRFWLCLLPLAMLVSGCGKDEQNTDLVISINPGSAAIVSGSDYSCVDQTLILTSRSVKEHRLKFSSVRLQWKSTTSDLYISAVRIVINNSGLSGGRFIATVDPSELEALFGRPGNKFPKVTSGTPPVYASESTTKPDPYEPCGLQVGGIKFANPDAPASFTTNVSIEVYGFSENEATGEQLPVKVVETVQAVSHGI